jgi:RNA polymerase sigma-70 factor, ECF subfamily
VKSEDALLVSSALAGDSQGYSLLFAKYWKRIYLFLRRRVYDNSVAEELTQETFIAAFRYLHTFRGDSSFYTWLCTIAINKASKRPFNGFTMDVETSTSVTPESITETKQELHGVSAIVETLPRKQRDALRLKIVDGLCYNEIGELLECSSKHAKNLVYKAKKTIRSQYDK